MVSAKEMDYGRYVFNPAKTSFSVRSAGSIGLLSNENELDKDLQTDFAMVLRQ
jgi:hypothetical protein